MALPKKTQQHLMQLTSDQLVDIITALADHSIENEKQVAFLLASTEPEKLAKMLTKEVNALARNAHKFHYKESAKVSTIIYDLISRVEKHLADTAPSLAINILKKLILLDAKLLERIDDSYGGITMAYESLYKVLDKAFANSGQTPEEIATYLVKIYSHDSYGNRFDLFREINTCLSGKKSAALEAAIADHELDPIRKTVIRKKIADLSGNVDQYINALSEHERSDSEAICGIAERLIKANRNKEATDWLLKITSNQYSAYKKDDLLLKAYQNLGLANKAQQLRWDIFNKCFDISRYKDYLKHVPANQKKSTEAKAIQAAQNTRQLYSGVSFLKEMKRYDLIEKLLLARFDEVDGSDYYSYRSLSTALAKNGSYLIASLLRRALAENGVARAQSKYYKYAASDYKLCGDYAKNVTNWGEFTPHQTFIEKFQGKHKRKKSFWLLVT